MNYVTSGAYVHLAIVIVIFAVMILLTYLAFSLSELIVKRIGNHLILVIGKIMGLILAIMGTGMAIDGIKLAGFDF
jgi:multiple antibiotic resistance protein